mmetsp:Transcript_4461/g.5570  ORF Transcript_4461/g.5570 Transcript_4461/m.5570 type:complete len:229 (-) Transcript_4461:121-807(-)
MKAFIAADAMLRLHCEDNLLKPCSNLCARTIFEPVPKSAAGIAKLQDAIYPRLGSNFAADRTVSSGLAVVLDLDGSLVGMSGVVVDKFPTTVPGLELPEGKAPRIAYVSVEPGMQRQGLATKLVRCCEDWAAARGETEMWVFVDNANTRAYNLYKKLGYIPVKEDISTQLPTAGQGVHEGTLHMEERILTLSRKDLPKWSWWKRTMHLVATWCSPASTRRLRAWQPRA